MKFLPLPLLVVTRRAGEHVIRMQSVRMPRYVVGFSSVERATAFLQLQDEQTWEFTLLNRPAMPDFVNELIRDELLGIFYDEDPAGGTGTAYTIDELKTQFSF